MVCVLQLQSMMSSSRLISDAAMMIHGRYTITRGDDTSTVLPGPTAALRHPRSNSTTCGHSVRRSGELVVSITTWPLSSPPSTHEMPPRTRLPLTVSSRTLRRRMPSVGLSAGVQSTFGGNTLEDDRSKVPSNVLWRVTWVGALDVLADSESAESAGASTNVRVKGVFEERATTRKSQLAEPDVLDVREISPSMRL